MASRNFDRSGQVILADLVNSNTHREDCRLSIGFFPVQTFRLGKGLCCQSGLVLLLQDLSEAQIRVSGFVLILNRLSKFKDGAFGISLFSQDGAQHGVGFGIIGLLLDGSPKRLDRLCGAIQLP